LATALAEMAFAGGLGATINLSRTAGPAVQLFSESNTRFVGEVPPEVAADFEKTLAGIPLARIGEVTSTGRVTIALDGQTMIDADIRTLKEAWQAPLRW
jgi:phosphoribosylformylglycinamidine synthase